MSDRATAAEKRIQALRLRQAGASYDEIAEVVGWANRSTAWRAVTGALDELEVETADQLRRLVFTRLERILAGGVYADALKGDTKAIAAVLAVLKEQRRYVPGLEVPAARDDDATTQVGPITVILAMPEPERLPPVPQDELGAIDTTARELPAGDMPPASPPRKAKKPAKKAAAAEAVDPLEALAARSTRRRP